MAETRVYDAEHLDRYVAELHEQVASLRNERPTGAAVIPFEGDGRDRRNAAPPQASPQVSPPPWTWGRDQG